MGLDPTRTVAELEELRELTGDGNGAQRVAWTDTWETAREWLRGKLAGTGAVEEIDEAGNQWFTLAGDSDRALLIGGHIDSVPNGGWLDGCLNVLAGVEVLRRIAEDGRLQQGDDEERGLGVGPLEQRSDHVVDVRHGRRVDGERALPAVMDPEPPEAFPEAPDQCEDGQEQQRAPCSLVDPSGPVHGPLHCDRRHRFVLTQRLGSRYGPGSAADGRRARGAPPPDR